MLKIGPLRLRQRRQSTFNTELKRMYMFSSSEFSPYETPEIAEIYVNTVDNSADEAAEYIVEKLMG